MSDTISRKGVFIPDITVEMFRNASLESIEDLMASGEMEDILLPSAQPERIRGRWIKISPAGIYECSVCGQNVMTDDIDVYHYCHGCGADMRESKGKYRKAVAWMPLPEPYREERREDG